MADYVLQLKNINKYFGKNHVIKNVNLNFEKGHFITFLGPSGCGKTTLLRMIAGFYEPDEGEILLNGKNIEKVPPYDRNTAMVFQEYALFPHMNVFDNVSYGLRVKKKSKDEIEKRVKQALALMQLEGMEKRFPNQMSGGQMQRVAIARALVNDPEILLADEPTGALDSETSVQIMEILKDISHEKLIIMVTHNPELASKYATRTVRLLDGKIVGDDNPCTESETSAPVTVKVKEHTSMSFATAMSLSLHNLMTKKARTLLTAFAGSIGIIGIALIPVVYSA